MDMSRPCEVVHSLPAKEPLAAAGIQFASTDWRCSHECLAIAFRSILRRRNAVLHRGTRRYDLKQDA